MHDWLMERNNLYRKILMDKYTNRNLGEVTDAQMRGMGNMLPCTPVQQSPLSNVIDGLRRKVNTLEAMYDGLQQKLAPVLVSFPEGPPTKEAGITGQQSAVVMELSELEYRLGILCRKIDTLITRIEA